MYNYPHNFYNTTPNNVLTLEQFYKILQNCEGNATEAMYEIKDILEPEQEMANADTIS